MNRKSELIRLIELPKIEDDCNLFYAESKNHIPFLIKRIYYITNANTKLNRGYHAHLKNQQILFCINGSITIVLDNGSKKERVKLKATGIGLFIDKMIWHEMIDFQKDTILLILASMIFDEKDYIRDYEKFKKEANKIP